MLRITPSICVVLLAGCLSGMVGCGIPWQDWDRIILRETDSPRRTPADLGFAYEDVSIPTSNNAKLAGWFVPAVSGAPLATLIVHTGIAGNMEDYLPMVPIGANNDFNVLVYDWQGYGDSEGVAHFANFEADTRAAIDYMLARPEGSTGVIQFGVSLGTSPAIAAATMYPDETVGLILYAPAFLDQVPSAWLKDSFGVLLWPVGLLGNNALELFLPEFMLAENYVGSIRVPILVITPEDDEIVPPPAQRKLYNRLPEPKQLYMTYGGHRGAAETDPELPGVIATWSKGVVADHNGQ
jgi:hypothetical protein